MRRSTIRVKADTTYKTGVACAAVVAAIGAALLAGVSQRAVSAADDKAHTTWSEYLGGGDSNQYSALKQINKGNVKQLDVAWTDRQPDDAVRECCLNDRIVAERLCEDGFAEPAHAVQTHEAFGAVAGDDLPRRGERALA